MSRCLIATVAIAVLETLEAIGFLLQIPLRTEGRTAVVYAPVPVPIVLIRSMETCTHKG